MFRKEGERSCEKESAPSSCLGVAARPTAPRRHRRSVYMQLSIRRNVSPRAPQQFFFAVILAKFSRDGSPRDASHDSQFRADLTSFGKPDDFTLLFACDGPMRVWHGVCLTPARVPPDFRGRSVRARARALSRTTHAGAPTGTPTSGKPRGPPTRPGKPQVVASRCTCVCICVCVRVRRWMNERAIVRVRMRRRWNVTPRRRDADRAATRRSREDWSPAGPHLVVTADEISRIKGTGRRFFPIILNLKAFRQSWFLFLISLCKKLNIIICFSQ